MGDKVRPFSLYHIYERPIDIMKNPYKTREGGATVTIFVPYDCNNNCPFCINKGEYADLTGFSLEKICESIRRMDAITPYCDFVFTGGEPFADIKKLQTMIDLIPTTHRVFINTTLPVFESQSEEDILAFAERNKHKITCINVSRHLQHYVVESNDDLLARLPVPFRVNCVLYKNYPAKDLVPYLERFLKIRCAEQLGLKGLSSSRPYFMQFTMQADERTFFEVLREQAEREIDHMELLYPNETPYFDKYDEFVPDELVRKGFAYGVLDIKGMLERIGQWTRRYLPKNDAPGLPSL